ncbi:MAG: serine/threonine protein kinase [Polyangiaceae bacterium]|nr:serine/threonine protein kinase [Polyangiaceae bacterium]
MGDEPQRTRRLDGVPPGLRATAQATTIRPEGFGATVPLVAEATRAAESLPRISVSLGETDLESLKGRSEIDLHFVGLLGEGGMGRVLLARQRSLQREVAVKTSKPSASAEVSQQLIHEGVITGKLEHPGIVPVHSLALDQAGRPVVVMKRIEGVEWATLIHDPEHEAWADWVSDNREEIDVEARRAAHLEILARVCEAVHFAHSRRILHRDIKPENVMLGRFGEVYLVDWGIALQLEAGQPGLGLAGTPAYMAPEMVRGGPIDERTDVYLLGATLHEVLTASYRHQGSSLQDVLDAAERSPLVQYDEGIPEELAQIANRATARDPSKRFANAEELRAALRTFLRHQTSVRLSREAQIRVETAEARLANDSQRGRTLAPASLREVSELLSVARFGFAQALEIWGENQLALAGQRECLVRLVQAEVLTRDARRARTWLAELEEAPPELEEQVQGLERQLAAAAERTAELQRMAADLDANVASRQRLRGAVYLGVAGVVFSVFGLYLVASGRQLTHARMVQLSIGMNLVVGGWLFGARKALLTNAFNRRLMGTLMLVLLGMLADRLIGWTLGTEPYTILVHDQLLMVLGVAVVSLTLNRNLMWMLVPLIPGLVITAAVPSLVPAVFSITTALAAGMAIWVTKATVRESESKAP